MAVIAAFVAGTIATATPVFAPPPEDDDGEGGWKAALNALPQSTYRVLDADSGSAQTIQAQAFCDEGDVLLSCGFFAVQTVIIHGVTPFAETQSCLVSAFVSEDIERSVTAYALCADKDPPHEP